MRIQCKNVVWVVIPSTVFEEVLYGEKTKTTHTNYPSVTGLEFVSPILFIILLTDLVTTCHCLAKHAPWGKRNNVYFCVLSIVDFADCITVYVV